MNIPEREQDIGLFRLRSIRFKKILVGIFYDVIFKYFIVKFARIQGGGEGEGKSDGLNISTAYRCTSNFCLFCVHNIR